jgi:hypothetical protein
MTPVQIILTTRNGLSTSTIHLLSKCCNASLAQSTFSYLSTMLVPALRCSYLLTSLTHFKSFVIPKGNADLCFFEYSIWRPLNDTINLDASTWVPTAQLTAIRSFINHRSQLSSRLLNSTWADSFGAYNVLNGLLSGLLSTPPYPWTSPKSLIFQFCSSSITTSLISSLAKNRPGHACAPWPKCSESCDIVTN